jgi:2-methylcitrate dehydratase PrpD
MTIGEQLAQHFASLDYDKIPAKHTAAARQLVLDYLGVAMRGVKRRACAPFSVPYPR